MFICLIFILTLTFVCPVFSQVINGCSFPQDTMLLKSCRQFHGYPSSYAICECKKCSLVTVNITCMPLTNTWVAPLNTHDMCFACKQVPTEQETNYQCHEEYIPLNMRCDREVTTSTRRTYTKTRSCNCKNSCRPVNLTCSTGGYWNYADQACQNYSSWEKSLGNHLNVHHNLGQFKLSCDQDYQLEGDSVATCSDGQFLFRRNPHCLRKAVTRNGKKNAASANSSTSSVVVLVSFAIAMSTLNVN